MKYLIAFLVASSSPAQAYMSHDEIVRELRGQDAPSASKRTKSGKPVPYEKLDKILRGKKKKSSKKDKQGWSRKRPVATPSPKPEATPSNSPTSSATPPASSTPIGSGGQGVDRRHCDTPVKSQGSTPRCTAYGTAAGMENLDCRGTSLSAANIWDLYGVAYSETAMREVPGNWITSWDKWSGNTSSPKSGWKESAKVKLVKTTYVNGKTLEDDLEIVKKAFDQGKVVNVGFTVAADLASCFKVVRASSATTRGGHHVQLSGYQLDKTLGAGMYLIIKNSWGSDCGDAGYQYFDPMFCAKGYCDFYVLEGIERKE
jgi:C1A family cysteine protease